MLSLRGRHQRTGSYTRSITFSTNSSSDQEPPQQMQRSSYGSSGLSDTPASPESQPSKFTHAKLSQQVVPTAESEESLNQAALNKEELSKLFEMKTSAESAVNLNKNEMFLRQFFMGFTKDFAIFKFKVGDKNINVSKLHFAERSKVYRDLIAKNSNESHQCTVTDFSIEALEQFANFIHFGQVENLDKIAGEVLILAEKYGIDELKDICSKYISGTTLSDQNTVQHLFKAFTTQDEKLKEDVLAYVTCADGKGKSFKEIMITAEWRTLAQLDYSLASEITDAVIQKLFD